MQDRPVIKTAIPKRRYQIGEFGATLLGEIESQSGEGYKYILAFVQSRQVQPCFYVCAEPTPPAEASAGKFRLRVINEVMSEVVDRADRWGDLDHFAEQALKLGVKALGLTSDRIVRLL